jgi:Spy/CpxP family protein refolding chaperone
MRRGLPWLLLALSVALNLFFVAGVLYSGALSGGERGTPVDVVAALQLDATQQEALAALRQRNQERREARRGDRGSSREALLDVLAQPDFEPDAILAQQRERNESWNQYMLETYEDLHGFMAGLKPGQRDKLLENAKDWSFLRALLRGPRDK